ncbi:MAG: ribonuclease HIII [Candidatus Auribacterota bacterium]|nr:ribonuclease HIII [Candidatus Auribacterota bacterium]
MESELKKVDDVSKEVISYSHPESLSAEKIHELKTILLRKGFKLGEKPHTAFFARSSNTSISVYSSGKVFVQGKGTRDFVEFIFEPLILKELTLVSPFLKKPDVTKRIGVDESGKGDFFGPLVVCAVCAGGDSILKLAKDGVRDSKKITSENKIQMLAKNIIRNAKVETVIIKPERFNELYEKMKNMNLILAWAHACAIENLLKKADCSLVIVDRFTTRPLLESMLKEKGKMAKIIQRTKGEEDIVVAAASICARACFVNEINLMGKKHEMLFPKGGKSDKILESLKGFVSKFGKDNLKKVAKINFKTAQEILR